MRSTNLPWAILTKPISRDPSENIGCVLGKFEWVRQNVGEMFFIVDGNKAKYAGLGSILIDDTRMNIDAFIYNGGNGILWGNWDYKDILESEALKKTLLHYGQNPLL